MTIGEKVYTAFAIVGAGYAFTGLALFHFVIIPKADTPSALYIVIAMLWMVAVTLTTTIILNLYYRSLLVIPTVLQCLILTLLLYFLPFAIWGVVLLIQRHKRDRDAALLRMAQDSA